MSKNEARAVYRARRNSIISSERARLSAMICDLALKWLAQRPEYSIVMLYSSYRSEVDLTELIEALIKDGRTVVMPKVSGMLLNLHIVRNLRTDMHEGAFGIEEPNPAIAERYYGMPHVVFLPGLAFDQQGGRLGYGGGYYDRFLASFEGEVRPYRFGVGYSIQFVDALDLEVHDVLMDALLTEQGIHFYT